MTRQESEQKLIDTCFELVLVATESEVLCERSREERAEWVGRQLNAIGYPTIPVGASWGVLQVKD